MGTLQKLVALLILILMGTSGVAQSVSTAMGARAGGLGNTSSTLRDEWSLFNNVGGISKVNHFSASFAYEVKPGLIGANRTGFAFISPIKVGSIGLGLFRFGDDIYNEQIITIGYGNQFGIAGLGLKLNYIQYRSQGFGTRNALSLNLGGIAQITPQISVGAYIVNLNQPKLSTVDKERLPTKLVVGLSLTPHEKLLLAIEVEKDLDYHPTFKGGLEYQIHKKINVRTGFNLHPNAAFFGLGLLIKKMHIDYAFQYAASLAAAHQASIIYPLEKKKTK